jgi:hypothetical protein
VLPYLASFDSTEGGYTPDGSGTAPIWDNSTGGWVSLWSYEVNAVGYDQKHLSYRGGASVPYLSGRTSPNGLDPIPFFDMHTIVGDLVVSDDDCAIQTPHMRINIWFPTLGRSRAMTRRTGGRISLLRPLFTAAALLTCFVGVMISMEIEVLCPRW